MKSRRKQDWNIFRQAIKLTQEKRLNSKEYVLKLLKSGKIDEFNKKRKEFKDLNLAGVDLSNTYLGNALLAGHEYDNVDFEGANFENSDLHGANLQEINFHKACFVNANLKGTKLSEAILDEADLTGANISETNLSDTYLNNANLSGSILCNVRFGGKANGTNFSNSIIINPSEFTFFKVDQNTDFSNAIIDDPFFIAYLNNRFPRPKNIPKAIIDKKQLRIILEQKKLSEDNIGFILEKSNLPS